MTTNLLSIDDAAGQQWDAIIVGTGMAGSTLGFALAKAGRRVLFCEAGHALLDPGEGLRGNYAETFFQPPCAPGSQHRGPLLQAGRRAEELQDVSSPRSFGHIPYIGYGSGGSSALYGAAMERFFPEDFLPRQNHPNAIDTTLPVTWPVSYEELLPYYEKAESLYRVRGSTDPLRAAPHPSFRPPPPLCSATSILAQQLIAKGLHPYRLPQACEFVPGCSGCQGFLCPKDCKNDAVRICLRPALDSHGAQILADCEVVSLTATHSAVTGVVCQHNGQNKVTLRGDQVILAAGALETPRILLHSASDIWPDGLANNSGLVGRNLMRHYVDMFAVQAAANKQIPGNLKEIAFNDFNIANGQKLGTVQSFGALPPASIIVEEMQSDLGNSGLKWLTPLFRIGKPAISQIVSVLLTHRIMLASIMEDLPYLDNRVTLTASNSSAERPGVRMNYRVHPEEHHRIRLFRQKVRDALKPAKVMLLKQAENNARIAHACGTCRFGDDPRDSVLDRTNRAHGLDNLYVVDSSFFPSSGGTNPALTIAANALRVADILLGDVSNRLEEHHLPSDESIAK